MKVKAHPCHKTHVGDRLQTVSSPTHPYTAAVGNPFTEIECDKNDCSTVPLAIG